jgi:hypothetical protein
VGEPTLQVTLPELLEVLFHMPNLETLKFIYTRVAEGIYKEHRHVQLPNLRKLVLEDHFNTCFTILRHLAPSSKCLVDIRTGDPPRDIPFDVYDNLWDSLKRYLGQRSYNDRLLVDLQPQYFSFADAYPDCYPAPTISIRITYDPQRCKGYALAFFDLLPRHKFEHVKSLRFRLNLPSLWLEITDDYLPTFIGFHDRLKSLDVLKTTIQGFSLLTSLSPSIDDDSYDDIEIPLPLPRLQRIRIIPSSDTDNDLGLDVELRPEFVEEFIRFFKKRKDRDCPIKHLDVRGYGGDLRKLDRPCKGLKVTWLDARYRSAGEPGEYICGTSNRGILNVVMT